MDPEKQQETTTATGRLGGVYFVWWTVLGTAIVSQGPGGPGATASGPTSSPSRASSAGPGPRSPRPYSLNKLEGSLMRADVGNSEEFSLSGLHAPEGGWG